MIRDARRGADERTGGAPDRLLTAERLASRRQVPKSHAYRLTRERESSALRRGLSTDHEAALTRARPRLRSVTRRFARTVIHASLPTEPGTPGGTLPRP